jgi:hypothetical protein
MESIQTEDYQVTINSDNDRIKFVGELRLQTKDYLPITELLNQVAIQKPPTITLDLLELRKFNSSGINMLTKFLLHLRNQSWSAVVIKGNQAIIWQRKYLRNLHRLMRGIEFNLEWY